MKQPTQNSQQLSQNNINNIESDVYHKRRKQTSYLVGMDDLEQGLADIIQNNAQAIAKISAEIKETHKEFVAYKKQIDYAQS
jgi:hypothetical protein